MAAKIQQLLSLADDQEKMSLLDEFTKRFKLELEKPKAKPKLPKQEYIGKTWLVENYKSGDLHFAEVNSSNSLQIFNCSDTTITVNAKVKNVLVEGCSKLTLRLTGVVTVLDLLNSSQVTVEAKVQLPMVNVEKSKEVKLLLDHATKSLKVQCSLSQSVFLRFPKANTPEGSNEKEDYLLQPVWELFEAQIIDDNLLTCAVKS